MSKKGVVGSPRNWRTRKNPFADHWDEVVELLEVMPDFEGIRLLEYLQGKYPGQYEDGQLRTLQRHLRLWRAENGEDKEIFFEQRHKPGVLMQMDWMDGNSLGVQVGRREFPHKLCHSVLTYSRWEWACVCFSEDFLSLRTTLQAAVFEVGGVPRKVQLDRTSAATHQLRRGESAREFNDSFRALLSHFGIPERRMINTGCPNENGSVESLHGHFRRRLNQALMLRGSRNFESPEAYDRFLFVELGKANGNRVKRTAEERQHLLQLPATRYPDFEEDSHQIGASSTVRIKKKVYSVPSRLIGFELKSRIYADRVELYLGSQRVHGMRRAFSEQAGIDWRDLVRGLLRKPGAFARYAHRDAMFPSNVYGELCRQLEESLGEKAGGREYLRILNGCLELDFGTATKAVDGLLCGQFPLSVEGFRGASGLSRPDSTLNSFEAELSVYDGLLAEVKHG